MATDKGYGQYYQIVVKGHLVSHWCKWFEGMDIENLPGGEAVLSGVVADQAMLHGLLIKIRDLGLPLISVRCLEHGNKCEEGESRFPKVGK
jgi:hypothetical protein